MEGTRKDFADEAEPALIVQLWGYRKSILIVTLCLGIVSILVVALFVSNYYRCETVFLPPELSEHSLPMVDALMSTAQGSFALSSFIKDKQSPIGEVIESRTVRDALVRKLGLVNAYGVGDVEVASRILKKRINVETSKSGAVRISIKDKDPKRATELVKMFLAEVEHRAKSVVRARVLHINEFLKERWRIADANLKQALREWREFMETHTALGAKESGEALTGVITGLLRERAQAQVEVRVLEASLGDEAPELLGKRLYLKEIDRQLESLLGPRNVSSYTNPNHEPLEKESELGQHLLASAREIPRLAAAERVRQLEIETHVRLSALLKLQLEATKLSLVRQEQVMQILDPPVKPLHPTNHKLNFLLIAVLLSVALGTGQAMIRLYLAHILESVQDL